MWSLMTVENALAKVTDEKGMVVYYVSLNNKSGIQFHLHRKILAEGDARSKLKILS